MKGGLFRDTLLYVPAQLIGPFAQFAVVVVWTHLLAPGPFGVVAFVMASHELTATLGHSWWTAYMLRFRRRHAGADPARFQAMDDRMVAFAVASQVAMAPLALAAVGAAPSPGLVAASAAYLVARSLVAHYSERARADRRIGAYSLVQIVGPALGAALSLVALMRVEASATAALAAMALGQCVGVALLFAALRFAPGRGRYDSAILHEAFRFGWPLMATGAFLWAAAQGVRLVVGAFDGADAVGLFSAGWGLGLRIAAVIAMLCTAAAFPLAVDRIESGDRAGALRQVALNGTLMAALLAPAAAGAALLSKPLVGLLIDPRYRAATVVIFPVAVATAALRLFKVHTCDQASLLIERTATSMRLNLLDAALSLGGAAAGAALGGIEGAAFGCLAGTACSVAFGVWYSATRFALPVPTGAHLRILAATAAMAAALAPMPKPPNAGAMAALVLSGAAIYFAALAALFPAFARDLAARAAPGRFSPRSR